MTEVTLTYHWRTFEEEVPKEKEPILIWSGTSPIYRAQHSERYGRRVTYNGIPWLLSYCKKKKLLWCYCSELEVF